MAHGSVEVRYHLWSVLPLKERRAGMAWPSSNAYVVQPESVGLLFKSSLASGSCTCL